MIQFERSTDYELIKQIVTHPRVYPHVSDDFSPAPEKWEPTRSEAVHYVIARDGEELLGMFLVYAENRVCWKGHVMMLPNAYGARARDVMLEFLAWFWSHTLAQKLIGEIPEFNRLSLRYVKQCGFREYGRNRKSIMKHGQLHDQVLVEVCKWDL